jgi:hypothetical protein
MTSRSVWLPLFLAWVNACDDGSPSTDAAVDQGFDVTRDVSQPPPVDARDAPSPPPPPPPFDAGQVPGCNVAAFTRHILDQSDGVEAIELGGLVATTGGLLVGVRQGAPRLAPGDASTMRRDTIDVTFVSSQGFAPDGLITLYDSAPMGTDLSPPSMVRTSDGALVLFRASRSIQTQPDYTTALLVARVDAQGRRVGDSTSLAGRGDPFATALPDGTAFVLAPRVVRQSDAGFVVAAPNVLRVRPNGSVIDVGGVDLTGLIPVTADSVLMRSTREGAAALFRIATDLQMVRFDAMGVVDPRGYYSRDVFAPRLDDGVALVDGNIVAWDDDRGLTHTIRVAVTAPDGTLRGVTTLDSFGDPASPVVSVTASYGGAAVTWIRGNGNTAMLRGTVMQPNGVMRAPVRDLLPVPGADGRLLTVGEGRELSFVARDRGLRGPASTGITVGRLCLPE